MRLIDADALAEKKFQERECNGLGEGPAYRQGWNDAIDAVMDNEPSAQPRKKGKWIWKDREVNRYRKETGTTEYGEVITIMVHDNYLQKINYCPVCGKRGDDTFMNYCPNCGAEMKGEGNADNSQI